MNDKPQPRTFRVEIRIGGNWVEIDELLPLAEHQTNAQELGATEIRTLDGTIHHFLNSKKANQ